MLPIQSTLIGREYLYTLPHGRHTYGMANGVPSGQSTLKGGGEKKTAQFKFVGKF